MNEYAVVSIIAMVGWLLLVGSSFASFRLGWSKTIQIALVWLAIFVGATLLVGLLMK
jgi:hypothetical protein